jgi:hypothetical protein
LFPGRARKQFRYKMSLWKNGRTAVKAALLAGAHARCSSAQRRTGATF